MNYLRGSITAAYQYYRDLPPINASTLTGAIDVIVIQRTDDNGDLVLACTPFHVRFGKWQILRPAEKKVTVLVNGRAIPFNMKIGDAGEAFFVFETDEDVPADLQTSPILQPTTPPQPSGSTPATGRFGAKAASASQTDLDTKDIVSGQEEQDQKEGQEDGIPEPDFLDLNASATPPKDSNAVPLTRLPPASSSVPTLLVESTNEDDASSTAVAAKLGKAALAAAKEEETERLGHLKDKLIAAQNIVANKIRRPSSDDSQPPQPDLGDEALPTHKKGGSPPPVAYLHDVVVDMAGYHSKEASDQTVTGPDRSYQFEDDITAAAAQRAQKELIRRHGAHSHDANTHDDATPTSSRAQSPDLESGPTIQVPRATSEPPSELGPSPDNSPPRYSWEWGNFPVQTPSKVSFPSHAPGEHERATSMPPSGEHVPASDGAGDDEDIDIHFGRGGWLSPTDDDRYLLEFKGRRTMFDLSLCGDLSEKSLEEAQALFDQKRVSYNRFIDQPAIVHKDDLTIQWRGRFISRKQSSPILAALVVWRQATVGASIVQSDEEPLSDGDERQQRPQPPKTAPAAQATPGRWTRWFGRSRAAREPTTTASTPTPESSANRPGLHPTSSAPNAVESLPLPVTTPGAVTPPTLQPIGTSTTHKNYIKTLRLTSEQLKELNLKKGPNSITFSLSATGVATCTARIFVWDATDQIVISDIDGTITKSDALGHVFTMIGRDWTHMGVAKLYTDICRNGYKIMYLTSRAIGQADSTRDYLRGINQNNYQLPEGPVIMSPDRLMASLHRQVYILSSQTIHLQNVFSEVIMRQPEVFKMACLRDIQRLFGPIHRNPFYAGFGNRITDALSYRSVNVPSGRIFTIDSSGDVKMELLELAGYKSSYIHMTDLVDQMFPPIHRKWAPEYTDVNFWRPPMPTFDFPDVTRPSSPSPSSPSSTLAALPPSPALSARSDASMQTGLSRLRNFSLRGSSSTSRPAQEFVPPGQSGGNDGSRNHTYQQHQRAKSSVGGNGRRNHQHHGRATSADASRENGIPMPSRRDGLSDDEQRAKNRLSVGSSMPGSYEEFHLDDSDEDDEEIEDEEGEEEYSDEEDEEDGEDEGSEEEEEDELPHEMDFDPLLETGEMDAIPFL
ncbi:Nuclear elongation and deformation protein 1 [Serendipita indica DSM 11827]|nr:Nuclear elongation and deformation protein 1 [Serendipita indica DSM 11827]